VAGSPTSSKPFPFVKAAVALIAVVVLLAGALLGVLWLLSVDLQMSVECGLAAAVCGLAGLMGLWVIALLERHQGIQGVVFGFLAGMGLRLLICGVAAAGAVALLGGVRVLLWFGLWYLVVLVVEANAVTSHLVFAALADKAEKSADATPDATP